MRSEVTFTNTDGVARSNQAGCGERDRNLPRRTFACDEHGSLIGAISEAASGCHSLGHRHPDRIRILAGLADLSEYVERAIVDDVGADSRGLDHSGRGQLLLNHLLKGGRGETAGLHLANQWNSDGAVVGD